MSDNNSTRRIGYNNDKFSNNFERIFGTEKNWQKRVDLYNAKASRNQPSRKSAYINKPIEPFMYPYLMTSINSLMSNSRSGALLENKFS